MYIRDVVRAIAPHVQPQRHLIVSIAAGVNLQSIEELLPAESRVVRHFFRIEPRQVASWLQVLNDPLLRAGEGDAQHAVPHRPSGISVLLWHSCNSRR